jgi:hypothetical protein
LDPCVGYTESNVTRRIFWVSFAPALAALAAEPAASVRGRLEPGKTPVLETGQGKRIRLLGDKPTIHVLHDERLKGADFEVVGRFKAPDEFQIDPIHKRAMFVHKAGQKLMISYWCDVCSIRTYEPGICMCCQEETALDLKESFDP